MYRLVSTIKVLIISSNGYEELHLPANEAVDFIKNQCANRGKWVYLDKDYADPDSLTERSIRDAKEIVLANTLIGG